MEPWIDPPGVPLAHEIMAIESPVERANAAHEALRSLRKLQSWFVRARGEAIANAYAAGIPYAVLGVDWGVSGERVRQMMFQVDDKRSGWCVGQDARCRPATSKPLPFGIVHAMRHHDATAACGLRPVHNLGADFTGTIYETCAECRRVVRRDLEERGVWTAD